MPYDPTRLQPHDPTSLTWAATWLRFILRDTRAPHQYDDLEVAGLLTATAYVHTTQAGIPVAYYRPHAAAATLITSDVNRAVQESIDNVQRTVRQPAAVATSIILDYEWMDALIEDATGVRPSLGLSFRVVF